MISIDIPECLALSKIVDIPAGTQIFQPGDNCNQFFYLLAGSIRVDMLSDSGKNILLYRFGAGQTCILTTSCLLSPSVYSASALAEQRVKACVISAQQFAAQLDSDAHFRALVFNTFAARIAALMAKVDEVAFSSIDRRLAVRLLELNSDSSCPVAVTHEQLAEDLGSAREVISRKLANWESKKWIHRQRGQIEVVDGAQLRLLIDFQC